MSAAVDHPISQALRALLHYVIDEEEEDEDKGKDREERGGRGDRGGAARKTPCTQ